MPKPRRFAVPLLAALLIIAALLLSVVVYLLGGSPLGKERGVAYTDAPAGDGDRPITVVVIDPGHGGEDGGASSASGVVEKDVNLAVAFALRDLFEAAGIPVVMTRTEDILLYDRGVNFQGRKKILDLAARQLIAEKTAQAASEEGGASLFISVHMNAFPAPQYSGMQVWYGVSDPLSREMADAIQTASLTLMPNNHRKTKAAGSSIYLLDRIKTPAVLVECGFLSNPAEAEKLAAEAYRYALAAVIFAGVVEGG